MRNKLLVFIIIMLLLLLLTNVPLFSEDNVGFNLESKSYFEEKGNETHIVNHRFSPVSIGYENVVVLDEQFDVSTLRGINGTQANLTVKAYSLNPINKGVLLYTITDKADYGQVITDYSPPFYSTTRKGTGGAEDAHSFFRLDNGKLLLTFSGEIASVEIANMRYYRIASYHSNQSSIDPVGLKKDASGIFTFTTPEHNVLKILFYVRKIPEWTPTIKFINNATGKGSNRLRIVGSSDEERAYYVSKLSIMLDFGDGNFVYIPINNGNLDIKRIKCPDNISYELIPNETMAKAMQLNEEGYKLYKLKKDSEAIMKYKEAIDLIEDPLFYYNYGNSLSNIFKYEEAIKAYKRAIQIGYIPSYLVQYNITCAYSRLGNIKEAYRFLHYAISDGYKNYKHIEEDPDLETLRNDKDWNSWFEKEKTNK